MLMHGFPAQDGFDVQLDESLCHWVKNFWMLNHVQVTLIVLITDIFISATSEIDTGSIDNL